MHPLYSEKRHLGPPCVAELALGNESSSLRQESLGNSLLNVACVGPLRPCLLPAQGSEDCGLPRCRRVQFTVPFAFLCLDKARTVLEIPSWISSCAFSQSPSIAVYTGWNGGSVVFNGHCPAPSSPVPEKQAWPVPLRSLAHFFTNLSSASHLFLLAT